MAEPLLYEVLFAWKCNSTHHKLALDALRHLRCAHAERWRDLFLGRIEPYLAGSKAPDNDFKDFKNHVLHVEENFWGGAVAAAQHWYQKTSAALAARNWSDFVYSAGVLSHYYSDPWQPFHTGQSDTEGVIHRAAEWSIACGYLELQQILEQDFGGYPDVAVPTGDDWLAEMIQEAALTAHEYYQPSISHYNFAVGKKDPPAGFDQEAKDFLAVLLGSAVIGYARILDRLITEADVVPPATNITLLGTLAQLTVPIFWVTKKLKSAKERAVIEAMYREFEATGKVLKTLPADDRAIRELHAQEVTKTPIEALDQAPIGPLGTAYGTGTPARPKGPTKPRPAAKPTPLKEPTAKATSAKGPQYHLRRDDLLEAAPSIGPKTAARLDAVGLRTVHDLLECDPDGIARKLNLKHIDAPTLRDWQRQATLVCTVPGLRGHDAQLLVACDITDREQLERATLDDLAPRIEAYARTSAGQRVLRDGAPPDRAEVARWIQAATTPAVAA
jgi:predicted flap endonuclease-1-like 5' DNA nuclease